MALLINHNTNTITTTSSGIITIQAATSFGYKNRIINGAMNVQQRGGTATTYTFVVPTTTASPSASIGYGLDRWFIIPTGASVTMSPVAVSGFNPTMYAQQITGAASVSAVILGQRIEQAHSYDLAGSTVSLSFWMSNSLLTSVTWTANYANTADAFGTIAGTTPAPTKTQISTGSITINSTLTKYSVQITIPSAATTGIEILFSVGAQTSGTWITTNVQVEKGAYVTDFEFRSIQDETTLCLRYYELFTVTGVAWSGYNATAAATNNYGNLTFKGRKRATPTAGGGSWSGGNISAISFANTTIDGTVAVITNTAIGNWSIYHSSNTLGFSAEL